PAADERIVAQTLRLQAEGEFSPELNDLVYDYSGRPDASGAVLLLALPGRYVEQIKAIAEAARLRVRAIMPSSAAVAAAQPSRSAMVLLGVGGVEFVAQSGGHLGAMRYVGPASTAPALLAGELRRAAALVLPNGQPPTDGQAQ